MAMCAGQLLQHVVGKDFRDQAHALDVGEVLAVGGGDARRLLAAMLQRVEAEIRLPCRVGMPVNGDDAAFFAQLVVCQVAVLGTAGTSKVAVGRELLSKCSRRLPTRPNRRQPPETATGIMPSPRRAERLQERWPRVRAARQATRR